MQKRNGFLHGIFFFAEALTELPQFLPLFVSSFKFAPQPELVHHRLVVEDVTPFGIERGIQKSAGGEDRSFNFRGDDDGVLHLTQSILSDDPVLLIFDVISVAAAAGDDGVVKGVLSVNADL